MKISNIIGKKNRALVKEMVRTDFKLRYRGSVLGYVWSLLRPLLMFGVLYVVFTKVIRVGNSIPYYPSYLLLGLVLWTFFVESTMSGMDSIVSRGDLIRKVSIPKYVIVISTTISALINLLINMIVVFIFMWIGHVPFRWTIALSPIFFLELIIFSLAISFLLATLFVKFRDFKHIWEVALQILFYATPILYSLSIVPKQLIKLMSISPLTQIFQDTRSLMITPDTVTTKEVFGSQIGRLIPLLIVVVLALVSAWYFRSNSKKFAEEL